MDPQPAPRPDPVPQVPFGPHRVSRLISGGNPLCGNSHFSHAWSEDMRGYSPPHRVVRYLHDLEAVKSPRISSLPLLRE